MNNVTKEGSLAEIFNEDFEKRVVLILTENKELFARFAKHINQNMFQNPTYKIMIGIMKDYLNKYEVTPGLFELDALLSEYAHNEIEKETYRETIKEFKTMTTQGSEMVEDKLTEFLMGKITFKVINQSRDLILQNGPRAIGDVMEKMNEVMSLTKASNEIPFSINEIQGDIFDVDNRKPIPTGMGDQIDNILNGGPAGGELMTIIGGSGFGKVQPNDARIVTPSGYKLMGDIKVGDYVIGQNGKPTKVIGVYPHKDWEFYRVEFSDGVSTECGKEHLWNVNNRYQRAVQKWGYDKNGVYRKVHKPDLSYQTMSLEEIMNKGLFKRGRHNFQIPMCEAVDFIEKELLVDPYVMGYMIGDGNFQRCEIAVGKDDRETLLENLNKSGHKYIFHDRSNTNRCDIISMIDLFRNLLEEYYDSSLISGGKYIHKDYLFNTKENRIALLNGLMDSDGTCQKNGYSCFNTKSKQLAEDVKQLIFSLGGFAKVREKKTGYSSKKHNEFRDCGIQYEVTITLCDPTIPIFRLKRKQDRVKYRTKYKNARYFHNIEFSRVCDGQCIKVEAEDELYLTDDFIVTHNTSLTTGMSVTAALRKTPQNHFQGFKVLQIFFEDNPKDIRAKMVAKLMNEEVAVIKRDPQLRKKASEFCRTDARYKTLCDNIRLLRLPTGEITARDIKSIIRQCINLGWKPDLVIIDYFECLKHVLGEVKDQWEAEGNTMRQFENMAHEFDIPIVLPIQGNKESVASEIVDLDKAGGSFKKLQISHIVIGIARTPEQRENNTATITIGKNRGGISGKNFVNAKFNNGTCTIDTSECDAIGSTEFYSQKEKDNAAKTQYSQQKLLSEINIKLAKDREAHTSENFV